MTTLNDVAGVTEENINTTMQPEIPSYEEPSRANEFIQKLLTAETGSGSVESYLDHPMNFNQTKGLARILRGLTGIIGNLNLAIIDVGIGLLEFTKPKKAAISYDTNSGVNGDI